MGDSGNYIYWWGRSPSVNTTTHFGSVYSEGNNMFNPANIPQSISPFGCI